MKSKIGNIMKIRFSAVGLLFLYSLNVSAVEWFSGNGELSIINPIGANETLPCEFSINIDKSESQIRIEGGHSCGTWGEGYTIGPVLIKGTSLISAKSGKNVGTFIGNIIHFSQADEKEFTEIKLISKDKIEFTRHEFGYWLKNGYRTIGEFSGVATLEN